MSGNQDDVILLRYAISVNKKHRRDINLKLKMGYLRVLAPLYIGFCATSNDEESKKCSLVVLKIHKKSKKRT